VTRDALIQHRLRAQGLKGPLASSAAEVVARFGAVQGEDYPLTRWALASRADGVGAADVDGEFAEGRFLRTHILRPTWHLVHRDDLRWMQRLSGPRVLATMARRHRELGLDGPTLRRATDVVVRALQTDGHLTRPELGQALIAADIDPTGQRLPHLLMFAEMESAICSGIPRGTHQTYALFDERVPPEVRFEGDEALGELARRYFTAHGPATELDFRWWSSLRAQEARRAIQVAADALECVEYDGRTYWFAPETALPPVRRVPAVRLLHVLDEYLIGYTHTRDLGIPAVPGLSTAFGPENRQHWIVDNGRIIGRWRLQRERTRFLISMMTVVATGKELRESLVRAAKLFARFYGMPVEVDFATG
jgi:hypothetical protein